MVRPLLGLQCISYFIIPKIFKRPISTQLGKKKKKKKLRFVLLSYITILNMLVYVHVVYFSLISLFRDY